jgi:hypothetical protein
MAKLVQHADGDGQGSEFVVSEMQLSQASEIAN